MAWIGSLDRYRQARLRFRAVFPLVVLPVIIIRPTDAIHQNFWIPLYLPDEWQCVAAEGGTNKEKEVCRLQFFAQSVVVLLFVHLSCCSVSVWYAIKKMAIWFLGFKFAIREAAARSTFNTKKAPRSGTGFIIVPWIGYENEATAACKVWVWVKEGGIGIYFRSKYPIQFYNFMHRWTYKEGQFHWNCPIDWRMTCMGSSCLIFYLCCWLSW